MAQQTQKRSASQTAMDTVGNLKDAAKLARDVGRVFAGDMSAIKDILLNKLFWEIILVAILIIAMVGMIIGGSIIGVLEYLSSSWQQHWAENDLEQAIISNGNLTAYQNSGWTVFVNTVGDVAGDLWDSIVGLWNTVTGQGVSEANGRDNSNLKDTDPEAYAAGQNPSEEDYEKVSQAILQNGETIGLTVALQERLDMIQGRVKQRGMQINNAVYAQYIGDRTSEYNSLAADLTKEMEFYWEDEDGTIILYAGFSEELSEENFNFDLSVFELSELQALKILAMFSIQHDCQLTEMDMWTLMDYCGWFDGSTTRLDDVADSIYEVSSQSQQFGSNIGDVVQANTAVPVQSFEMQELRIPRWRGSCAPQWYYEEIAQLLKDNPDTELDLSLYEELDSCKTFGIIDRLYYAAENNLTIMRTDYSSASDYTREEIAALDNPYVYVLWNTYVWGQETITENGIVRRDDEGNHSYTFTGNVTNGNSSIDYDKNGNVYREVIDTLYVELYKITGSSEPTLVESKEWESGITFTCLEADTTYRIKPVHHVSTTFYLNIYDNNNELFKHIVVSQTTTSYTTAEEEKSTATFKTFCDRKEVLTYQLYAELNLTFQVRSIDELALDLLGVWPGELIGTMQVERITEEENLISKCEDGTYSYCLRNANMLDFLEWAKGKDYYCDKINYYLGEDPDWLNRLILQDAPLWKSYTVHEGDSFPRRVVKWVIEYGINMDEPLTSASSNITSGWHSVSQDKDHLIFEIEENSCYYVYCRITEITEILTNQGTYTTAREQVLFQIDTIVPYDGAAGPDSQADARIENGDIYADGHLGNDNLRLSWTDVYTDPDGVEHTLNFTRMTGYQYESYVDIVMALAELLEIPYDDWEPAMQRAEELGLVRPE